MCSTRFVVALISPSPKDPPRNDDYDVDVIKILLLLCLSVPSFALLGRYVLLTILLVLYIVCRLELEVETNCELVTVTVHFQLIRGTQIPLHTHTDMQRSLEQFI